LTIGSVCGIELPTDLQLCDKLPSPIFTPSTKAAVGIHDENITNAEAEKQVDAMSKPGTYAKVRVLSSRGRFFDVLFCFSRTHLSILSAKMRDLSLKVYSAAAKHAATVGVLLADTKFEWGLDEDGELVLADEILTPDSSRFWPAATYAPGRNQDSFDKQYIRDWMESINYNKTDPLVIPQDRVMMTVEKYRECFQLITGGPVDLSPVGL
jgi:phosphoribosylaminoimidazole-succinocarboxamide synthase